MTNRSGGGLGDALRLAANFIDVIDSEGRKHDAVESRKQDAVGVEQVSNAHCLTCGDKAVVGQPGHEVPCPACVVACPTCKGRGNVGAKGHEVSCPKCQGKGR